MPHLRLGSALVVALSLTGCAADRAGGRWQNSSGSAPDMSATADCHAQANRMAAARYPDQVQRAPDGTTYRLSNQDRFAAEIRLYESCLQAKGYNRDKT